MLSQFQPALYLHLVCFLGFYVVIYRIGYRETFNVKVEAFIDKICDLEAREDPVNSAATIAEVRTAARRVTHM